MCLPNLYKVYTRYKNKFNVSDIFHCIYIQVCDTYTIVSTVLTIVSVWDSRMHYKFWYIGSVLWKIWRLLNRVETCCHKNNLCNKLLCLTEIYTLCDGGKKAVERLKNRRIKAGGYSLNRYGGWQRLLLEHCVNRGFPAFIWQRAPPGWFAGRTWKNSSKWFT